MISTRSITDLLAGAALVVGAAIASGSAQAAPISLGKSAAIAFESDVSLVRDGCGRGWRFSNRRGECVPEHGGPQRFHGGDRDGHPDRRRGDHRRNNNNDAAAAVATGAVILGIIAAGAANKNRNNNNGNAKPHNPNFKKKN